MRHERGFALPLTVLLITLITVMLASGFARARADRDVAEGQEVSAEALAVARSGLHTFLEAQATRPTDGFVDTMYVTGGYAIVTADIVQNPADTLASQTWIVRSTGYVIDAGTGATPRARRTVAQFAEWQTGTINVRGALTAPNGITYHNKGTININGSDACGVESAVPGLRTAGVNGSPPTVTLTGNPNLVDEGNSAGATVADETNIDWQSILDGGIIADYDNTLPSLGNNTYPITIFTGDLSTGILWGTGLLIVEGNLSTSSIVFWTGIVLVGGKLDLGGSFNLFRGVVVTGLNEQLTSGNPQRTDLGWTGSGSGNILYLDYDACAVVASLDGLTGFAPVDDAWVDNWATY